MVKYEKSRILAENTIAFTNNKGHEKLTKWGLLNIKTQEVILKEEYKHIFYDSKSKIYIIGKVLKIELDIENMSFKETIELNNDFTKKVLKFCALDDNFNVIVPLEYKDISIVNNKYFIVKDDNWNTGVLDFRGKVILSPNYNEIWCDQENHFFIFKKKDEVGFLDLNGRVHFEYKYSSYKNSSKSLGDKFKNTTIFGFDGLPFDVQMYEWNEYTPYHLVVQKNDFYGVVDITGKVLLPFEYDDIDEDDNLILTLKKNGKTTRILYENLIEN